MKIRVIIFGLGEISELAYYYLTKDKQYEVVAFCVDQAFRDRDTFFDLPVVDFESVEKVYPTPEFSMFLPIGYRKVNQLREEKYNEAKLKGYSCVSYVSPNATIGGNVNIGENCFIFEDNTIQPFVNIEKNCILWSGNHIGHHSTIKANCFITSHVVVSGGVEVGENTFIGINATLRDHIKIGKANVIGAGAIILGDTEDDKVYITKATEASRLPSFRLRGI